MGRHSQRRLRELRGYDSGGNANAPPVTGFAPTAASIAAAGAVARVIATLVPTGGAAPYTYAMSVSAGLAAAFTGNQLKTTVDPAGTVGLHTATVVVTDGLGRSYSSTLAVTLT